MFAGFGLAAVLAVLGLGAAVFSGVVAEDFGGGSFLSTFFEAAFALAPETTGGEADFSVLAAAIGCFSDVGGDGAVGGLNGTHAVVSRAASIHILAQNTLFDPSRRIFLIPVA